MKRIFSILLLTISFSQISKAQEDGYVHLGEFGVTLGAGHYFGDLNTRGGLQRPKPALGIFFRKQFGNYVGLRVAGRYTQVSYSDIYSKNDYQRNRNLSFNSEIFEFAVQGDFNFFKFVPNSNNYFFTPYLTLGLGVFSYDPYDYFGGNKIFLRDLGTEGQNGGYLGRKPYESMAVCVPFGIGVKYNINSDMNLSLEICHRFTTTDYIDDVSTTYATNKYTADANNPNMFPDGPGGPSIAYYMQDRSIEIDAQNPLSKVAGRQRGWSKQKDQYIIAEIGLSFNISTYRCPTSK